MAGDMHERLLNQEPGIPLHQALAVTLEEQIREGVWPVGSAIPPEVTLCKLYSISRHTLRHALGTLEDGGLIVRRQGAPTRVISRQRPRRFTQSFNSPADILRYPRETYRVNEVEEYLECDADLANFLKVPVGSSWYHIGAMRKQQDSELTIAWSDIYILPKFAELTSEPDHTHSMVYQQIERRFDVRIDRAAVDVYACGASPEIAQALSVPLDSPCLAIIRHYFDANGNPFEISVTYHPENRFIYSMEFRG
jgi:DNA-binding GntR family transcriptional regulator